MSLPEHLLSAKTVLVQQRKEIAELAGFETRNKYEVRDVNGKSIGFCAEQQKGVRGFLVRQILGHWRKFELQFFDGSRNPVMRADHPFRWFFKALEIQKSDGQPIGSLEQRFGLLTKKFDVHDAHGDVKFTMRSALLSFWTFPFFDNRGEVVAVIRKRWSGALKELFTDADNFQIEFYSPMLSAEDRLLILTGAIFVDLRYFERKG